MTNSTLPRPDASMDLLNNIKRDALEPGYGAEPRPDARRRVQRIPVVITMIVIGLLGGIALATTMRAAPTVAGERADLIARIGEAEAAVDSKQEQVLRLGEENAQLESDAAGLGASELERLRDLSARTGSIAVTGPGIVVTVDDGPDPGVTGSRVVDADLRQIVNSLWKSGAEAIAVNGHRLSARTAIRAAGDAITVDYRSVSGPYTVAAIGDPGTLKSRFESSTAADWWRALKKTYGMRFEVKQTDRLTLPADPGLGIARAEPAA